jgi:hypothetical protein
MAQTYLSGSITTLLSTELNSLATNGLKVPASSGTYSAGGGYLLAELELVVTFGAAPTANTGVSVWFIRAVDATPNYEDGYDAAVTPGRAADVVFPLRAVTTAQRIIRRIVIPPGTWIPLLKNDGTNQSFAATGNTLKILPLTYQ